MEGNFEYIKVVSALDTYHVEDIGNTILFANNDTGFEWVLDIHTDLGKATIREFGPLHYEESLSTAWFTVNIETKDFNEKYISKRISNFLNDPKREITQVSDGTIEELREKIARVQRLIGSTNPEYSL